MRIQDQGGKGKAPAPGAKSEKTADKKSAAEKQKPFAEKLRKADERQAKSDEATTPLTPQFAAKAMFQPARDPDREQVTQTTSVAAPLPASMNELVREIQVRVHHAGSTEIEIQFTSQTFEDLRVNIKKEDGAVSIRFSTTNENTSKLLTQNIPQLSKALATRDIPAVISVQSARDSSWDRRSGDSGGRSRKRR